MSHHNEHEMSGQNNNVLVGIIILLLVIIAVLAFFVGRNMGNPGTSNTPTQEVAALDITIIDDARCTTCQTDTIVDQLKLVPALAGATFTEKQFTDDGVSEMLKDEGITTLPAAIFSRNGITGLDAYLNQLPSGNYSLALGSTFDPFAKRSERGFLVMEKAILDTIKSGAYVKGNTAAPITWLEYSDLECPYCARLHNSGTPKEIMEKYGESINMIFQHFPLDFHANAKPGAEVLECLAAQKGGDAFYSLIELSFSEENSKRSFLVDEAVKLGANKESLESCLAASTYEDKIDMQQKIGADTFGITGTPGNVLINNETGEYEVLSGAYPTASFEDVIDRLLAK